MSPFGHDFSSCGTEEHPCRSIAQAVYQVDWRGEIYLIGTETEIIPYNCSLRSHVEQPGIFVNKSLTLRGVLSPHVICVEGFHFQKINDVVSTLHGV